MENENPVIPPQPAPENVPPSQPEVPAQSVSSVPGGISPKFIIAVVAILLLAGGSVGVYTQLAPRPTPIPVPTAAPVQAQPPQELSLSLSTPSVNTVSDARLLTVSGMTAPDTSVVLMTETHDVDVQSDGQGNFTGEIELDSGVNYLTVTAFASDGQEKTMTQEVVYDDQVLGRKTGQDEDNSSSVAGTNSGRKFTVRDSLESISNSHKVDKTTVFTDENNKPVKSNSIKPQDRVIAIVESEDGGTNSGQLKKALKIIARSSTDSAQLRVTRRRAVQGVVTALSGTTIQLTHQIQRDRLYNVIFNDRTVVTALGSSGSANLVTTLIQVGQRIIVMGNAADNGDILASRIRIIPGKATGVFVKQPVTPFPTMTIAPTPISTPSATPTVTVTPTATPSPSVTPSPTVTPIPTP